MIKEKSFMVLVKAGSKKTEFLGFDKDRGTYVVAVAAPAKKNKANIGLVKFLTKLTGRMVVIKSGLSSRLKIVDVV